MMFDKSRFNHLKILETWTKQRIIIRFTDLDKKNQGEKKTLAF